MDSAAEGSYTTLKGWKLFVEIASVSLIVFGAAAVAFQICAIVAGENPLDSVGAGIWCGIVYIATSTVALFAVRIDSKAMTIGLLCMAAASDVTSLALITLAALSFKHPNQENLYVVSNSILIAVGVMGLGVSLALLIVAALALRSHKQFKVPIVNEEKVVQEESDEEEIEKDPVINETSTIPSTGPFMPLYPPSEVVAVIHPEIIECNSSSNGSGIYDTVELESEIQSELQEPMKKPVEPIYAIPNKKKSTDSVHPSSSDFEIQVDQPNIVEEKVNKQDPVEHLWFRAEAYEDLVNSDAEESSVNIELPKEDVIVHAPPPDMIISSPNLQGRTSL